MVGNPKLSCDEISVGDEREQQVVENLTRTQIVQYAGASGDFNPIHHDETFATKAAGYPSVFAHGMLSMGLTGKLLTDWLGDGVLRSYGVRFVRQVWPGDTLTARGTVKAIETVDACVGRIVEKTLSRKGALIITADHGNAEQMWDPANDCPHTAHTTYDVPLIVVNADPKASEPITLRPGRLADIAPTALAILGLQPPASMTGENLLAPATAAT